MELEELRLEALKEINNNKDIIKNYLSTLTDANPKYFIDIDSFYGEFDEFNVEVLFDRFKFDIKVKNTNDNYELMMDCCSSGLETRKRNPGKVDAYLMMAEIWKHENEILGLVDKLSFEALSEYQIEKMNEM